MREVHVHLVRVRLSRELDATGARVPVRAAPYEVVLVEYDDVGVGVAVVLLDGAEAHAGDEEVVDAPGECDVPGPGAVVQAHLELVLLILRIVAASVALLDPGASGRQARRSKSLRSSVVAAPNEGASALGLCHQSSEFTSKPGYIVGRYRWYTGSAHIAAARRSSSGRHASRRSRHPPRRERPAPSDDDWSETPAARCDAARPVSASAETATVAIAVHTPRPDRDWFSDSRIASRLACLPAARRLAGRGTEWTRCCDEKKHPPRGAGTAVNRASQEVKYVNNTPRAKLQYGNTVALRVGI